MKKNIVNVMCITIITALLTGCSFGKTEMETTSKVQNTIEETTTIDIDTGTQKQNNIENEEQKVTEKSKKLILKTGIWYNAKENTSDYVQIDGLSVDESTISGLLGFNRRIEFEIWGNLKTKTKYEAIYEFEGRSDIDDYSIKGTISIYSDKVIVNIKQCESEFIQPGNLSFEYYEKIKEYEGSDVFESGKVKEGTYYSKKSLKGNFVDIQSINSFRGDISSTCGGLDVTATIGFKNKTFFAPISLEFKLPYYRVQYVETKFTAMAEKKDDDTNDNIISGIMRLYNDKIVIKIIESSDTIPSGTIQYQYYTSKHISEK